MRLPPSSAASPVSSMRPTIRRPGIPSRRPEMRSVSPTPRPFRAAHDAGTSASVGESAESAMPSVRLGRRIVASTSGSMPSTRSVKTRSSSPGAVETVRRRSDTGAAATTPGCARIACTVRGPKPSSAKARRRTSARPRSEVVALSSACSEADPATIVPVTAATPSAMPMTARAVRRRTRQQAAPRERSEAHRSYSPRAESRRMSGVASWSLRRPRSISSRISPSRTTSTRSA